MHLSEPVLVVVGAGAAGLSAAVEAARHHPGRVLVLDQAPLVSIGTCGLPYLMGGQIADPASLILHSVGELQERGLEVRTRHRVESIDLKARRLEVCDLTTGRKILIPYQNLLLTPGGQAPYSGSQYPNVIAPRCLESSLKARAYLQQPECREVLVVGAGYLGLELVEAVRATGRVPTLVDPVTDLLGFRSSALLEQELEAQGVQRVRQRVVAWEGKDLAYRAILQDGRSLAFDLALVATGVRPDHPLLQGLHLERGHLGGIRVDRQAKTSQPGVWAAGDCCEIPGRWGQSAQYQPLARPAALLGQVAGASVSGQTARFAGCLPCVAVKVFGLEVAWAGEFPEGCEVVSRRSLLRSAYWDAQGWLDLTLFADRVTGVVRGAQALGSGGAAARIQTLALAINQELSLEQLALSDYAYSPPISGLWDPIVRTIRLAKGGHGSHGKQDHGL